MPSHLTIAFAHVTLVHWHLVTTSMFVVIFTLTATFTFCTLLLHSHMLPLDLCTLLLPLRMLPLHLCALLLPSHLLLPLCLEPCCCLHAYCWLCACCPHAFTPSYCFHALCLALPFSNTYSPPFPPPLLLFHSLVVFTPCVLCVSRYSFPNFLCRWGSLELSVTSILTKLS